MVQQGITREGIADRIQDQIEMLEVISLCMENEGDDQLVMSLSATRGMRKIISDTTSNLWKIQEEILEHFPKEAA